MTEAPRPTPSRTFRPSACGSRDQALRITRSFASNMLLPCHVIGSPPVEPLLPVELDSSTQIAEDKRRFVICLRRMLVPLIILRAQRVPCDKHPSAHEALLHRWK